MLQKEMQIQESSPDHHCEAGPLMVAVVHFLEVGKQSWSFIDYTSSSLPFRLCNNFELRADNTEGQ